jgi:hypothetical protein
MLKIVRSTDRDRVVFTLSGRLEVEHAAELQRAIAAEAPPIVFDLKELKLVDRDVVPCLARWETDGILLESCPAYIREWIARARSRGS